MDTDKRLIDYSNRLTKYLICHGLHMAQVIILVKDYQKKYYEIKNRGCSYDILELYTPILWWKQNIINGVFIIDKNTELNIGVGK